MVRYLGPKPTNTTQRRRNPASHNKEEVQNLVMWSLVPAQLYTPYTDTTESSFRCYVPHTRPTYLLLSALPFIHFLVPLNASLISSSWLKIGVLYCENVWPILEGKLRSKPEETCEAVGIVLISDLFGQAQIFRVPS